MGGGCCEHNVTSLCSRWLQVSDSRVWTWLLVNISHHLLPWSVLLCPGLPTSLLWRQALSMCVQCQQLQSPVRSGQWILPSQWYQHPLLSRWLPSDYQSRLMLFFLFVRDWYSQLLDVCNAHNRLHLHRFCWSQHLHFVVSASFHLSIIPVIALSSDAVMASFQSREGHFDTEDMIPINILSLFLTVSPSRRMWYFMKLTQMHLLLDPSHLIHYARKM